MSLCDRNKAPDRLPQLARGYLEGTNTFDLFRGGLLSVLYKVGAVGIKPADNERVHFSFDSSFIFRHEDLNDDVRISIAPMLWRALGNRRVKRRETIVSG